MPTCLHSAWVTEVATPMALWKKKVLGVLKRIWDNPPIWRRAMLCVCCMFVFAVLGFVFKCNKKFLDILMIYCIYNTSNARDLYTKIFTYHSSMLRVYPRGRTPKVEFILENSWHWSVVLIKLIGWKGARLGPAVWVSHETCSSKDSKVLCCTRTVSFSRQKAPSDKQCTCQDAWWKGRP